MGIGHIKTAEQRTIIQQYGDWYWVHWPLWVGCYIWYSGEGTGRGPSPSRPLLAVPNGTAHPSTVSVPITALLYNGPLLCGFNVPIKCYTREPNRPKWVHLHQASKSNFGLLWPWPLTSWPPKYLPCRPLVPICIQISSFVFRILYSQVW